MKRKSIPESVRKNIFKKDNYICQSCGVKVNNDKNNDHKANVDHIVPIDLHGDNHINNYQTLCRTCNLMKHNKPYPKGFNIKLYTLIWELVDLDRWYIYQLKEDEQKGYCKLSKFGIDCKGRLNQYSDKLDEFRNYINENVDNKFINNWYGLFTKKQEMYFRNYPRTSNIYHPIKTSLDVYNE
jgi:hypothetical protein